MNRLHYPNHANNVVVVTFVATGLLAVAFIALINIFWMPVAITTLGLPPLMIPFAYAARRIDYPETSWSEATFLGLGSGIVLLVPLFALLIFLAGPEVIFDGP